MVRGSSRILLPLLVFIISAGVWAAGAVDEEREARWQLLHRGFTRQYIEECLVRRERPGWSLEDETDLAMGYWWLMAEDFGEPTVQDQLFTVVQRGISYCRRTMDENNLPPQYESLIGNLITMAGQVQVARGNYLSAARHAREGQKLLDRVRQTNPEIADTYFSLGLYLYYADLSSPLVRSLQRLLFFPPGNSRLGLLYLEKAALQSKRFGPMARVALATIYSNGEKQHSNALSHLRTLRRQYPENPLFLSLTVKVLSELGDLDRARELLEEADKKVSNGVLPFTEYHRNVFRVLRAELELEDYALDTAYENLILVMENDESGPIWVQPVAAYSLARLYLLSGNESAYSAVLSKVHRGDDSGRHRKRIKKLPRRLLDDGYIPDLHPVFRYWIAGDLDLALQHLDRLRQIKGNTGLLSFLLGELHLQRGEPGKARDGFRDYLSLGSGVNPWVAGWCLIRLGDIEAGRGDFDAASRYYRQAESREEFSDSFVAVYRIELLARKEARRHQGQPG
jgi:tetratricopeptide (TPR) repeat protein